MIIVSQRVLDRGVSSHTPELQEWTPSSAESATAQQNQSKVMIPSKTMGMIAMELSESMKAAGSRSVPSC